MIGETLRKERESQNLSVQDIEKGTSIRAIYIEAIEQGEYDKLPGEVYAKGFIKNYGNFLNLDGDSLVRQFIEEISPPVPVPEETEAGTENAQEIKPAPSDTGVKARQKSKEAEQVDESDSEKPLYHLLALADARKYLVAAVAIIALLVGGLIYGFSGSDEEKEIANSQTETKKPSDNQQIAQVTPEPVQPVQVQPAANDVNLQATFSDDCWTQVVADGAIIFEGVINAGQTFNWGGKQSVYVVLGNAGAVQFVKNGQNLGVLGGEGEVVDRVFTP